ncbi:MAG: trigger factor [Candidatus Nanopelagicaceae bacterium]|nr:trigger factor [Actinomycetota bacterium]NCV43559.1 trigger factor [Actinomycetota bacterium]NCV95566.1 trigger factor [Actinomycetota bacterium]NCW47350.1 trigger factor [Actinomycetota bacterium]NCW75733.1 trigger factor [Actinomycetota bacterium]
MKSAVENLSPTRVRISIDVDFKDLEPHVTVAYETLAQQVSIPGFRKGKVPRQLIDQRVGRGTVLNEAINNALPEFYTKAARENDVLVVGRPSVDIKEVKDNELLKFEVEVDIRPEVKLPDFSAIELSVDDVVVTDKDVDEQIEALRTRFGTLTTIEKDASSGDFVTIDLVAKLDGKEVEGGTANGISYEVGSNRMIDGLDAALEGMKVGESKTFNTQLVGMKEGDTGEVTVTLQAVKKRELPDLNDEFAKLASEFETLDELKSDSRERLSRLKAMEQGAQARDNLLKHLLDTVEILVPEQLVKDEVDDHLEKENRLEDETHRKEVTDEVTRSVRADFLLDSIVKAEEVQVTEAELTEYLIRTAARYGMSPDQFAQQLSQAGQIAALMAEVARTKALAVVLERVKIKDASGREVDLSKLAPKPAAEEKSE